MDDLYTFSRWSTWRKKRPNFSEDCFPILEHGEMMLMFTSHDCYEGKKKRSLQSRPYSGNSVMLGSYKWHVQLLTSLLVLYYFPTLFSHLKAWNTPVWMQRQGTWNQILSSYRLDNLYQVTPHIRTHWPICKSCRTTPTSQGYWEDDRMPEDAWKWWMHGQESVNHSWMETSVWVI